MGGLTPPAAMATRRLLCSAQNRCHMSQDEYGGGGEHVVGVEGDRGMHLELNGPTRGSEAYFEVSAKR